MSINKTIELTWKGQTYTCKVNMATIDRLEESINLHQFMLEVFRGDIRFTKVAKLFALLLQSAGCKVTNEEAYQGMFGSGDIKSEEVTPVLYAFFAAVFPEPPKKSEATPGAKPKNGRKKSAGRGVTSTS